MAALNHSDDFFRLLSVVVAMALEGCAGPVNNAPPSAQAAELGCPPITHNEIHAPGDPHWIGHDVKQLRQVLGKEEMSLGKPSENLVLVYGRAGKDCLDAYVIDHCDRVINYYCRPVPVAPMNWGRQPPVPETQ